MKRFFHRLLFWMRFCFSHRRDISPIVEILEQMGYFSSVRSRLPLDGERRAIPWYTYPAIDFLRQFSFENKKILEYGSGYSTIWWSERAKSVTTMEQNQKWYEDLKPILPCNVLYQYESNTEKFVNAIQGKYDVIIIDAEQRDLCAEVALKYIADDGIIIIDDSQRVQSIGEYQKALACLQNDERFIQVDFAGLSPCVGMTKITTFFLSRNFHFNRMNLHSPDYCIGNYINEQ